MSHRLESGERSRDWRAAFGWFALALALRLVFLGRFSLWGDEEYSLGDALRWGSLPSRPNQLAYPLFFLLERAALEIGGLVGVARPDPERLQWWLRIVPALAGAAAAGAMFVSARGFLERRERHLLSAFVCFSPWLLFYSQYARHYTLLLALATPACFGMVRAWREASLRAGVRAAVWLLFAILTHPTALLLLAGHVAGVTLLALFGVRRLNRGVIGPLAVPVLLAIPACIWPGPVVKLLMYRLHESDAAAASVGGLLRGVGYNVGPTIGALALLGLPLLWRRDRTLCLQLITTVAVPFVTLVAMAARHKSVEERYLMPLLPLAFCPAAIAVAALATRVSAARAGGLLVSVAALAPFVPGILSNYFDGDRPDLARAADYVTARLQKGDGIIAETHALLRRYLPSDFPGDRLLEAPPPPKIADATQYAEMWSACPRLWIVVPADFEDKSEETDNFQRWAWQEGRLQEQMGLPRLDYHQNRIRVFLVEPKSAEQWTTSWSAR